MVTMPDDEEVADTPGLDHSSPFSSTFSFFSPKPSYRPGKHQNSPPHHQNNPSQHQNENPQTPPPHKPRPRRPYQQHTRSPSLPLSLHHLGIGTPSPLLRQLSHFSHSPSTPGLGLGPGLGIVHPSQTDADDELSDTDSPYQQNPYAEREVEMDDLTQDRKDVLVERLGDLIRRLQRVPDAEVLDVLHARVDEMEGILRGNVEDRPRLGLGQGGSGSVGFMGMMRSTNEDIAGDGAVVDGIAVGRGAWDGVGGDGVVGGDGIMSGDERKDGNLATPPWLETARFDHQDIPGVVKAKAQPEVSRQPRMSEQVVAEADSLNARLLEVVQSLRARKEESDHIHALLVERAEAAAERILELEKEVVDLEDELGGNESDLRHLRIELRAVETLCHESVQSSADPELVRSIDNWKADWARLRDKMSVNKRRRAGRRVEDGDSTLLMSSVASISTLGGSGM